MTRTHSVRRPVSGFTLIELLVVTLILSILMAVAIPLYLSSVADARIKTSQANMQTIANAVQAAHVKNVDVDYTAYAGPVDITKEPDLQAIPLDPNKGTYTIKAFNDASGNPTFSVTNETAGTFQPGVGVTGAAGGNNGGGAAK